MWDCAFAIAVVVAVGVLYVASRRAVTIAELEVDHGHVRVQRGKIAPSVLASLRDVAKRPPIAHLRITLTRSSGRAVVDLRGKVSEVQAQQIRNVIGTVPLARLINAPRRR